MLLKFKGVIKGACGTSQATSVSSVLSVVCLTAQYFTPPGVGTAHWWCSQSFLHCSGFAAALDCGSAGSR